MVTNADYEEMAEVLQGLLVGIVPELIITIITSPVHEIVSVE